MSARSRRAVASAMLFAWALAGCNPQPSPGPSPTPSPNASAGSSPPLIISGQGTPERPVRIVQQIGNRKQYELLARSYESRGVQGAARATFQDVHVTFYGKDGSTLQAQAPQAVVDEIANTVTLLPTVQARSSNAITLFCDRLVYNRATQMFHGEGNVVIANGRGLRATGSSIDTDVTLTKTRMQ
ncbi:MAG: LPS export ABC transporter periplasmic protein LptC [Vulcanimicrobiaceae bacterium]